MHDVNRNAASIMKSLMTTSVESSVSDKSISIILLMGKKPNRLFNITAVFKNEKNQVGVSPGHTEHIFNTSLSPVIKKTVTYTINDYLSLIIGTQDKLQYCASADFP